MNYRAISYFLQLCEEKTITLAAKKLFITQQGLSKAIYSFESDLGFPLFRRGERKFELTPQGKEFYKIAKEYQALDGRIQSCIDNLRALSKNIKIAVTMGVLLSLEEGAIENFKQSVSPFNVDIFETTDFECENSVENDSIDFGITAGPVDGAKFFDIPLKQRRMYAVISLLNPLSQQKTITFADLKDEQFILASKKFKTYYDFINKCRQNGFEPKIQTTTMEMMVVYSQSRQNQGIGISADLPFAMEEYPGVKLVPFLKSEFSQELFLISSKSKQRVAGDEDIIEAILQHMR